MIAFSLLCFLMMSQHFAFSLDKKSTFFFISSRRRNFLASFFFQPAMVFLFDAAITASMKAGADVPGVTPFRAVDGKPFAAAKAHLKLGGQELTLPVKPNAKSVTFKLKLKPGRDELWAKFTNAEGVPMGAFYSYVTKIE